MNKRIEKRLVLKKSVKNALNKLLLVIIIFLLGLIFTKNNPFLKDKINTKLYESNLPFMKTKQVYEKYFGKLLSVNKIVKEESVFSEKLSFSKIEKYHDGVKLKVTDNYMVPIIESGVVVFIGNKDNYGNTIIVEQVNGIDVFYSNIKTNNIKLYDYVEKGELLGEVNDNKLYLVFEKDGKYLDYKEFI